MDSNTKIVVDDEYTIRFLDYKGDTCYTVKYDPTHKMTISTWKGWLPDEDVINCYKYTGFFCNENNYPVKRGLIDLRQYEGSFDGSNKWMVEKYMPAIAKQGYKYTAMVKSPDFYTHLAIEDLLDVTNNSVTIQVFDDYDEGYQWIIHMPD